MKYSEKFGKFLPGYKKKFRQLSDDFFISLLLSKVIELADVFSNFDTIILFNIHKFRLIKSVCCVSLKNFTTIKI